MTRGKLPRRDTNYGWYLHQATEILAEHDEKQAITMDVKVNVVNR